MELNIYAIPTLKDNYVWTIINESHRFALVVDPGEAAPVIDYLKEHRLVLQGILITHHHWDHTNGVSELIQHYPAPVFASARCHIPDITHHLEEHQSINLDGFPLIQVIDIPGHTLDHIAYYAPGILFCGDTLFSAGCGRAFEGIPEQLYASLQKIVALPNDTKIYCAHEYTLNNLRFAQQVEPENLDIHQHMQTVMALRENNQPTLPSVLQLENAINPFLRCHIPSVIEHVQQYVGRDLQNAVDVFCELRYWKDRF